MERQVDVPGGLLHSVADGDGPPILLLHAGIVDLRAWDPMVPGLVAAGYRAIRSDARAFGSSTTEDVPYSNRADVVAVLDAWGVERAALVGNSRGGQVAYDTAIEFPDRVVAVVGVGAGLSGHEAPPTPAEQAIFDEWERIAARDPLDPVELTDFEVALWVDGPGQPAGRVDAAIRDLVRTMNLPLNTPGRIEGRPIVLDPPAVGRLAELRCPVLAIAGDLDLTDVAAAARDLAAHAPNARAVIMPGVAHMIGLEAPARLNQLIVEFLDPLRPWS